MGTSDIKSVAAPEVVFANWLGGFADVVAEQDANRFALLFADDGYWRDILAFSWAHRTFAGEDAIAAGFAATAKRALANNLRLAARRSAPRLVKRSGRVVIEGYFDFDTSVGHGAGFVRLLHDDTDPFGPKIWLLLTTLHEIRGFEEKAGASRPSGAHYSQIVTPHSWLQEREKERTFADRDPQVLIIGAGQGGLILAARLRQMGVDALIVEKTERVGDTWRQRYNNLTLHNEIIANQFPYLEFPATWPVWLPKDMLAGWLEAYAEFLELNVWTSTEVHDPRYDDHAREWALSIKRADGSVRTMRCKHLVMATGVSGGPPRWPKLPGLAEFGGRVIHSSQFKSGLEFAGKRAIVIGTGNSGHDVAQDLFVSGAESVSMLQRGATCVVSLDPGARISYAIFGEGRPVADVDLMTAAIPYPILIDTYRWVTRRTRELDRDLLDKLHAVGFRTHDGVDETGFQLFYLRGVGGYYINVGCSELIIEKKIGLLQQSDSDRFVADGLRMKDGTTVKAEIVVLATGFEGMQENVRNVLGDAVADRIGPVWGFDKDYVMRNMWRRTAQEGLWLMGGAIIEARLYSRFLALEIKASLERLLPAQDAT